MQYLFYFGAAFRCAMSGGGGRQQQRNGSKGRDSTPGSSGYMLVTSPEQQMLHSALPQKPMAALQNSGKIALGGWGGVQIWFIILMFLPPVPDQEQCKS